MLFSNVVAEPFGGARQFHSADDTTLRSWLPPMRCARPHTRPPQFRHALVGAALRIWASRSSMHSNATYAARWAAIPFTS